MCNILPVTSIIRLFREFGTKDGWPEGLGERGMAVTVSEEGYSNVRDP
jgi:hypothetical protein